MIQGAYDVKCSTEGSTGVVLRDLRKDDRPGATVTAPWAIMSENTPSRRIRRAVLWSRKVCASYCYAIWVGYAPGALRIWRGRVCVLVRPEQLPGPEEAWRLAAREKAVCMVMLL